MSFFKYYKNFENVLQNHPLAPIDLSVIRASYDQGVSLKARLPNPNAVAAEAFPEPKRSTPTIARAITGCRLLHAGMVMLDNQQRYAEFWKAVEASGSALTDATIADVRVGIPAVWFLEEWADVWDELATCLRKVAEFSRHYGLDPRAFLSLSEYAVARRNRTIQPSPEVDLSNFQVNGNSLYVEAETARLHLMEKLTADMAVVRSRVQSPNARTKQGRKIIRSEWNLKATRYLRKHHNATIRELSKHLDCSEGMVGKLSAWKNVMRKRKKDRKPKLPRAISLTSKIEANIGGSDEELEKLMREQAEDKRHGDRLLNRRP